MGSYRQAHSSTREKHSSSHDCLGMGQVNYQEVTSLSLEVCRQKL